MLVCIAAGEGGDGGSTKTLWSALRSLLSCICVEVSVVRERKMTVAEQKEWLNRADVQSGFLARAAISSPADQEADAVLNQLCEAEPSDAGSEPSSSNTALTVSTCATSDVADAPAAKRLRRGKDVSQSDSQIAREGASLRLPVEVEIHRRIFYFDNEGNLLDAKRARCVKDGEYRPQTQSRGAQGATSETASLKVTGVDFVGQWRVFSSELGDSVPVRSLLGRQAPSSSVERELAALAAPQEPRLGVTSEQQAVFRSAAEGSGLARALHIKEADGCIYMNEPIPAKAFAAELKSLSAKKEKFSNRLCSQQLLEEYRKASRSERIRLDREHEQKALGWMGPKDTAKLTWLETVDRTAAAPTGGIRWLSVVYQKRKGFGRDTASWPSLQSCEGELRKNLMKHVAHDWDIVSCHCFIVEAVVRGFIGLEPKEVIPVLWRYNRSRAADVLAGRTSSENEFLCSIASWYEVTVAEAKFGPLVLLNQGTTTAWLKELDPPRQVPDKGDHPDLVKLQSEALVVRKLFFEHAATLFPPAAFEGLKTRLLSEYGNGSLQSTEQMQKKLFSYCLMHFESVALRICTDVSAKHGLPPLTFVYDGFLQLHVEGAGAPASEAVKREAEAALLAHFKSPIYLVEKEFYEQPKDTNDSIDYGMIAS